MGGCIPESLIDTPLDFDELAKLGAPIGAGSMLVLDEDTDMVDVTLYFLQYLCDESCGKCVPCREGIRQMLKILNNIKEGTGKKGDIELLEEIAEVTGAASLCALGKTAADPLLSTLRYFSEEFEAKIEEAKSPAGKRD
jgi:NADH-quinone oxidoreductase subunit F